MGDVKGNEMVDTVDTVDTVGQLCQLCQLCTLAEMVPLCGRNEIILRYGFVGLSAAVIEP